MPLTLDCFTRLSAAWRIDSDQRAEQLWPIGYTWGIAHGGRSTDVREKRAVKVRRGKRR
jgi:hypothetical protein